MNRIILIGNGFDLAHGLKTSYNDFIDWIVESKHKYLEENRYRYEDNDISYSPGKYNNINIPLEKVKEVFSTSNDTFFMPLFAGDTSYVNDQSFSYGSVNYKNSFLKLIIQSRYIKGWADIETMFYDELNRLLNDEKTTDKEIKKFNSDFQRIINLLEEYLLIVVKSNNLIEEDIENRILSLLTNNPVSQNDMSIEFKNSKETRIRGIEKQLALDKILILDFNYTKTISKYFANSTNGVIMNKIEYINIHGTLNDQLNPIIFGFGDELDENYLKIEKSRLTGVLEYIKSINYLRTSNYRSVLNFLELYNFQVFTWGHSCGLTDRTLLNHIFEHNNCASIKPFYYQWFDEKTEKYSNNYIEVVSNIARNFTDKNKLRDRVVDLSRCEQLIK
ncbi:Bacteriophage abortive infection AbiH [Chishuiella changwenlii]|uniref:Bacteriophage abortive infection AbiH n=1 Tax=Chishuiella changwenlii TaxID=1434701 RepID=A0A1M6ZY82_9FLAO|nr:AbiH family protein [Chishuiella changwenlii]GGE92201.1 hypothetical protein GCM10010984_07350 [Chishuiella changwenlii]SHL35305.1 Bacteriophage abortive infection AbiH [Chishuiella changwenlii]